jgi:cytochrome oxidase Cu insertion factor (SCO1/SenC/PrrC family)
MQPHLDALQSRCHFLDLTVDSERDKMLRIKQVHRDADGGLFADYSFTQEQTDEIMAFIDVNHNKLREVSLRMCLKIADLVKISGNWRELAKATCMKG